MSKIDISQVKDEKMKPVYLVMAIYEIRNTQADEERNFDQIIVNEQILDMIDTINFTYVKNGLEPTESIKKVGYLLNLQTYLDPNRKTNNITFTNDDKETCELEVVL